MSQTLIIDNIPYPYPNPGDEPGWGEGATDWAAAVTAVLNSLLGPDDIAQTTFSIGNFVTVFANANITGLIFNTATVRSAIIEYSVYRISTANPSGNAESGIISIVYDNNAAPGSQWSMSVNNVTGNAGILFSITDAGQFQYNTTDITALGYSGVIKFRAKSLAQ
jgi:hypothetical protein